MHWLTQNAIADMPGPRFLLVYAVFVLFTVVAVRIRTRRLDSPIEPDFPAAPGKWKLSNYQIAYLRGGAPRLLAVVLFDLCRRGYLQMLPAAERGPMIARPEGTGELGLLDEFERAIFEEVKSPRSILELRRDKQIASLTQAYCAKLEEPLKDDLLLMPPEYQREAFRLGWSAAACLLLLAGYKILLALAKGRQNVGFLIVLGIAGTIAVLVAARIPRLTRQGREYLDRLRLAFDDWPGRVASAPDAVADPSAVMAIALLGLPALAGTTMQAAWRPLMRQTDAAGCGCGGAGGCGAAVGGAGGGCGSGGGGCGGGGCGGGGCGGGGCGGCGG